MQRRFDMRPQGVTRPRGGLGRRRCARRREVQMEPSEPQQGHVQCRVLHHTCNDHEWRVQVEL
eukprot:2655736-Prymnesium_polylepis.1